MGFLSNHKVIVGFDLSHKFSQISYSLFESDNVETVSLVTGGEDFNIPTVLCKRAGVNQWFFGKEAINYSKENQGILVENLIELARNREPVFVDNESFDPVALLTLYVKRCLGLLTPIVSADKIDALMITCENIDQTMLEILSGVIAGLRLKTDKVAFQNYTESFYSYLIRQPVELWIPQSVLFAESENSITVYRMECNRQTTPVVAFIEERQFPFKESDEAFLRIVKETCDGKPIGSAFLIGNGFSRQWMKESLKYLCRGKRVFQGNNLFSKGACLGMKERLKESDLSKEYVFLGNDKLKANIGMKLLYRGEENYFALLDAGINWYEAERELEFYIQEGNVLTLMITPLNGKSKRLEAVKLDDFYDSIARVRLHIHMESEKLILLEIEDLGFGEIRPSAGRIWREQIELA